LLRNLFTGEKVNLVLSLPVSVTDQGDVQVWRGTKTDIFLLKSANYIQKDLEAKGVAECSLRQGKNTI
jgi:hypothetical protein